MNIRTKEENDSLVGRKWFVLCLLHVDNNDNNENRKSKRMSWQVQEKIVIDSVWLCFQNESSAIENKENSI